MKEFPSELLNQIDGEQRPAGDSLALLDPHSGRQIARFPRSGNAEIEAAVKAARSAQPGWDAVPGVRRGEILHQIANLIEARSDELSRIVAAEAGKKLADARGEIGAAVQCARFFAGEGQRLFGRTMPSGMVGRWAMTIRRPCGVAGLIIAANTPAPNFAWKVFPALICGNAVVLKTAEDTPASSWLLGRLCEEAGLPKGVLNVVHGLGPEAGQALIEHPDVDVLSFTGSTRVGRMIAESAGRRLKKVSLELGGKNALVVCDDADLDLAVKWSLLAAFSNAGQRCAAGSRILVFDAVYPEFSEKLVSAAKALKLGVEEDCDLGPVINQRQLDNMIAAIERAVGGGASLLCGGTRATSGEHAGFYMQPTVISDPDPRSELSQTELFGPITALYRVSGFDQAVSVVNDSPYGLTASIHTRDIDRALSFARQAHVGVAVVNGGTHGSEPHMPFGGVNASGNGTREPGTEALEVYSDLRVVYLNSLPPR
uniref:Aldehyde dehydrogenase n=1 Tax=Rhodopseudomonas palustris (strain BisA53) TaxID=316055 RepID=Q07IS5_RHOP5